MDAKHKVFNLIILDESGSMSSIKRSIISGFNEVVQTVKGVAKQFPEQEHLISFVTFNSLQVKTHFENEDVTKLELIDENQYHPNAMTPLYDAIGLSISQLRKVTDVLSGYHVLVTILTDGEENDSKEYTGQAIKQLIDELKLQQWTFTYIGANHDVEKFALSISISNTMKFDPNERDLKRMFSKESTARKNFSAKLLRNDSLIDDFYAEESGDKE